MAFSAHAKPLHNKHSLRSAHRQYILGDHYVKRSARNISHIRPLTQLTWTGSFVDELAREGKTSTLRDVFYSAQAYEMSFADQAESDDIITDLETVLGHAREDFNVFPRNAAPFSAI